MSRHKSVPPLSLNMTNHIHASAKRPPPAVRVEWPGEGHVISQLGYTFNIEAEPGAQAVEVSINTGDWLPCRQALGLWWFDWTGYAKGDYELVVRCRTDQGPSTFSALRRFSVA